MIVSLPFRDKVAEFSAFTPWRQAEQVFDFLARLSVRDEPEADYTSFSSGCTSQDGPCTPDFCSGSDCTGDAHPYTEECPSDKIPASGYGEHCWRSVDNNREYVCCDCIILCEEPELESQLCYCGGTGAW
jgi:hypothetical protein